MRKVLVFLMACFVLAPSSVVTCPQPAAAQVVPASPLPSAPPASVLDHTVSVDGVPVPLRDFATLIAAMLFVYVPGKNAPAKGVIVTKKQSEMPAFDPDFHYAGSDGAPGQPQLTMWISDRLNGRAPRAVMESAAILGLLDSGFGGAQFQRVYAAARKDDLALGPAETDTWKNRRALSVRLTSMVELIMDEIKQRQAAGSIRP
ncbi:MAG: hypothetical protein JO079_06570 [Frankiaceae bacterium]|nr:hypothetical protein [Frankiaceae bacterium]